MDGVALRFIGYFLVMTRLSAFFLIAPVFSWKVIPNRVKVSLILLLSIFFLVFFEIAMPAGEMSIVAVIVALCSEAVYGLALGLITVLLFSAVKMAGAIIEQQMGFSMSEVLDPLTGESSNPMGMLLETLFVLVFLASNGHHIFLLVMQRSYELFPAGTAPEVGTLVNGIVEAGSIMLMAGLRLSAPMLAAFLMLLMVLAIFARIIPDMNILFISMPFRVGMGLIMAGIFMPLFLSGYMSEFSDWLGKLLPI